MNRFSLTKSACVAALVLVFGLGSFSTVSAAPVFWTVNAVFENGKSLTGTFYFDATTSMASNWNLTGASGFNYTPANSLFSSGQCCTDQFEFDFTAGSGSLVLAFAFNPDLTNAGGTSHIAGGSESFTLVDKPPVFVNIDPTKGGGAVSGAGTSIPEPGTAALGLAGIAVGALVHRRRAATR